MANTPNPPAKSEGQAPAVQPAAPIVPGAVDTAALVKAVAKTQVGNQGSVIANVDSIPANWDIKATDDDNIIDCTNNVSGSTFVGTHKDFSAFMAGKLNKE